MTGPQAMDIEMKHFHGKHFSHWGGRGKSDRDCKTDKHDRQRDDTSQDRHDKHDMHDKAWWRRKHDDDDRGRGRDAKKCDDRVKDDDKDGDEDDGPVAEPPEPQPKTDTASETVLSTGQTLELSITSTDITVDGTAPLSATIGLVGASAANINVIYVIDESGSINAAEFDLESGALVSLTQSMIDLGFGNDQVTIGVVPFSTTATSDGVFTPADAADETVVNAALEAAITSRTSSGNTNFEAPLQEAIALLQANAGVGDTNIVYFLSDGESNVGGPFDDEVATLTDPAGLNAQVIAIGIPGANTVQLDTIDNTGGSTVIDDIADLDAALLGSPIENAEVDDFFVLVNGTEVPGLDEDDLVETPFGYSLPEQTLSGLSTAAGTTNTVELVVSFDDPDDTTITIPLEIDGGITGFA